MKIDKRVCAFVLFLFIGLLLIDILSRKEIKILNERIKIKQDVVNLLRPYCDTIHVMVYDTIRYEVPARPIYLVYEGDTIRIAYE